ncbi:MAG: polysulfide reductase NrfD [SAR324 cluster bacterium]|nr:polysulfide reductase NrfD [SAR324 cluster bacterium]
MKVVRFFLQSALEIFRGGRVYWTWVAMLGFLALVGLYCYVYQFQVGALHSTDLGEEVPWGIYIANFAFMVGIAAAAVMLVIPAYIFHQESIKEVVIMGEVIAATACIMCILFILASLGRPDRLWHILPFIGRLNFPSSMLAWDVVVINTYLILNLIIPTYMLYTKFEGREPNPKIYFPLVLLSIFFAISIHTVTAFLFSSNVSRPFWHSSILGPRFLASAFSSGPAFMILILQVIDRQTKLKVSAKVIESLALITAVALQISLFLLGAEFFTDFYSQTQHASSIQYLFFGLEGHNHLVPWIWTAVALNVTAVFILSVHKLRNNKLFLNIACLLLIVGIWIEKGMGLVIPGFIPSPLGDIVEYSPSIYEIGVCVGIWAIGGLIFTFLAKMTVPIEIGAFRKERLSEKDPHWGKQTANRMINVAD